MPVAVCYLQFRNSSKGTHSRLGQASCKFVSLNVRYGIVNDDAELLQTKRFLGDGVDEILASYAFILSYTFSPYVLPNLECVPKVFVMPEVV